MDLDRPTHDEKELVTEQRIYRKVDEDRMFAEFEAGLAKQREEDQRRKEEKKRVKKEEKKKSKDKKHKKSKHKSKKRKRHSSDSSSSDSDSDGDAKELSKQMKAAAEMGGDDIARAMRSQSNRINSTATTDAPKDEKAKEAPQREDWMMTPRSLTQSKKQEPEQQKKDGGPYISSRELNPQLNPDSNLESAKSYLVGDGGRRWQERSRMRDSHGGDSHRDDRGRDDRSDRPRDDRRRDDRDRSDHDRGSDRSRGRDYENRGYSSRGDEEGRYPRPRDDRGRDDRSDRHRDDRDRPSDSRQSSDNDRPAAPAAQRPSVPAEDFSGVDPNKLASQIMKAELMGDAATSQQLKDKLERYKRFLNGDADEEDDGVVRVSDIDSSGRSRSATTRKEIDSRPEEDPSVPRKRRKITETYDDQKRSRYFKDDDVDLKTLIEREKRGVGKDMDAAFADNLMRSNNFKMDVFQADNMDGDDVNYQMWEAKENKMSKEKLREKERQKAIQDFKRMEDKEKQCYYCFQNRKVPKHTMLALGEHAYVMIPDKQLVDFHCFIVPVEHASALTTMEEAVWDEVEKFMISLTSMFQAHGFAAVFFETVLSFRGKRHTVVECIPLPKEEAFSAPVYFQKAILESETEWSQHKKLIDTSGKGVRKCIPPNFAYFYVQFGLKNGFAHVIEDEKKFSRFFGREIIAGILKLDAEKYIFKPRRKTLEEERTQMQKLLEMFAKFDWTAQLDG